jgi:hypothetical protein
MICLLTRPQYTQRLYDNSIDFRCLAILLYVRACCQEHQVVFGRLSFGFGMSPAYLICFWVPIFLPYLSVRPCVCMTACLYCITTPQYKLSWLIYFVFLPTPFRHVLGFCLTILYRHFFYLTDIIRHFLSVLCYYDISVENIGICLVFENIDERNL